MNRRDLISGVLALLGIGGAAAVVEKAEPEEQIDEMPSPIVYGRSAWRETVDVEVPRKWIEDLRHPWKSFNALMNDFMVPSFPPEWPKDRGRLRLLVPAAMWWRLVNDTKNLPGENFPGEYATSTRDMCWRGIKIVLHDVAPEYRETATFCICQVQDSFFYPQPPATWMGTDTVSFPRHHNWRLENGHGP